MLLNDIVQAIHENEETEWESEAPYHHYNVKYDVDTKRLEVYFVEEYHYDGDNWGEIEARYVETKVFFAEFISAEKYINLLVSIVNKSRDELEYYYGNTLDKVCFDRV